MKTTIAILTLLGALATGGCGDAGTAQDVPGSAAGDTAPWELLDADQVNPESTALRLGVTRLGCASGKTGTVLEPAVTVEIDRVVIRTDVEPFGEDAADCQGNDVVPVAVELDEPLGQRALIDGACLEGEAVETAPCIDGAARWEP